MVKPAWIACQLGAREHYAVPRALHRYGRLHAMITDAWTRPGNPIVHVPIDQARRLAERFHPDLDSAMVQDLTLSLLRQEIDWRIQRRKDWDLLMVRNNWFQRAAAEIIATVSMPRSRPVAVFAHSYSARDIFLAAKRRGWTTVLGQIDPGEEHFTIVRRLADANPQYGFAPPAPPLEYIEQWREECALADHIVVNSDWSRAAIGTAGIDTAKVRVLPLAYESVEPAAPPRAYPERFTAERPLRLLFVGSVSVVKGVPELLEAMALLRDLPVTLQLVGAVSMEIPATASRLPSVDLVGAVPRGEVNGFYASSDVLMFPSHSDGFGMAQIEAQARGLPIVASTHCGRVVDDEVTGLLLPEVTALSMARVVQRLVANPSLLTRFSQQAVRAERSTLQPLGQALVKLVAV
jgi:glycosyltransferase involved in cell wall biosynthesis